MPKKVKIKDIAKLAGVSTGTVDRVIHRRGKVSPEAAAKVNQAIQKLEYKPDIIARTLARQSPLNLTTLLPYPYQDPYWKKIKEGIDVGLAEFEVFSLHNQTRFFDIHDKDHFLHIFSEIGEDGSDALILGSDFYKETKDVLQIWRKKEKPVILLNPEIKSVPYLSFIGIDSYAAGRLAGKIILSTRNLQKILVVHLSQDLNNNIHLRNKELGLIEILRKSPKPFEFFHLNLNPAELSRQELSEKISAFTQRHGIDTVYCSNSMAYLFADILKTILPDIYILGHDLIGENIPLLKRGKIDAIIDQRAHQQGYLSIKVPVDHMIRSQKVFPEIHLPLDIIYQENMSFYLKSEFQAPLR